MLKNSFSHIPGIGIKTERRIWNQGIHTWDDAIQRLPDSVLKIQGAPFRWILDESKVHLYREDPVFFSKLLPSNLHWRLFPEFRNHVAFLDIETTGISEWENEITTIALFDGKEIYHFINGENLHSFPERIEQYRLLVTYNGKSFDIPFIERFFGIQLTCAHIDLRYVLKSLGFKGGLKGCEKQIGIDRGILNGVDGFFAVLLWKEYRTTRNPRILETLLAYNISDVLSLEELMIESYNLKLLDTPFSDLLCIEKPAVRNNPFIPDLYIIEKIRDNYLRGSSDYTMRLSNEFK
ncbi:MAG: ribonuclease H-like domain-containing protein [Thermodesulfobacteriota bacterium]